MPTTRHLLRLTLPRWAAKRLEILAVRGNTCEGCGIRGAIVHVHHGHYEGDRLPWDYPDDSLHVYCATCHGKAQALMSAMNEMLGRLSLREYEEAMRLIRPLALRVGEARGGLLAVSR